MRKVLLLSILLFLSFSLFSQSNSWAEQNARSFYILNHPYPNQSIDDLAVDTVMAYKNLAIVNFSSPRGFVIVRNLADERDVIAYSFSDHFSFDADTTGVIETLADALVESSPDVGYQPTVDISRLKTGRLPIEPLVRTAWNQGSPYNYYCPLDLEENKRTLVGCVAVAVGQIIRYYDKWNNFQIEHSYEHDVYGKLTCFAGHYNWEAMENQCDGINNEVARLLYHCGVLVNMGYGPSSSGASSGMAASLFSEIYDGGGLNNDPYGSQESFYNSISNYKPIYSTYAGHAFVCDGFDGNSFYHFNLGWGGSANGYYPLSNVLGKSLLSAIFDTAPSDSLPPPGNLQKSIHSDSEMEISWNGPEGDRSGLTGYSIYLDDHYFGETSDTLFIHQCLPGSHYLRVTSNWTTGESRWIGPASYYCEGNEVPIADNNLRNAINTGAGIPPSQRNSHTPTEGELNGIRSLSVSNASSLTGISHCENLHRLVLFSSRSGKDLDLTELAECGNLMLLKITNYAPANPDPIGSLTKLQDLYLNGNSFTNMTFLSSLKSLYKLEIFDNNFQDIGFLNGLDRLVWITLKGCGIQSFEQLDNSYGIEYLDVSDNEISDIEWLNSNRTIRTINARNNQLSGQINLNGLTLLRTLNLSQNQIEQIHVSSSPSINTLYLANNQLESLTAILTDNKQLIQLDVSSNQIDSLPSISNTISILNLGDNLLFDLVPLDDYGDVVELNLQSNRIVDISPFLTKNYASRLNQLDLRNNPLSKESYLFYRPLISGLAGSARFPSQYNSGSPCYLSPCGDSILMKGPIQLNWEGDFNAESLLYDLYLIRDIEPASKIASDLAANNFDFDITESGSYTWFVVGRNNDEYLHSGYQTFKVFKSFSLPFLDDFEIYSPTKKLCSQSPYWQIFGEDQNSNKDAFVIDNRSYDGEKSIKIAGLTDLVFPISDYLTGYGRIKFKLMVDPNRQACIQSLMSDGSTIEFDFYGIEMAEIYHDQNKQKYFQYQQRSWMEMEIRTDPTNGAQWFVDGQLMLDLDNALALDGIRFATLDGRGSYQSAPAVFYIDNFTIEAGFLLSIHNSLEDSGFPVKIFYNGTDIVVENPPSGLQRIDFYNLQGQLIQSTSIHDPLSEICHVPFHPDDPMIIAVLYDNRNRRYAMKIAAIVY